MADGRLLKRGSGFDNTGLTAVPADVKAPVRFLGAKGAGCDPAPF